MTIAAKVSSTEVDNILRDRYVNQYFEARLIDLPAFNYDPTVAGGDATLLAGEVPLGTGGYQRAVIYFTNADVGNYADGGVPMNQKATIFAHDGSGTPIAFSHVALVWSGGNALTLGNPSTSPDGMTNGTYTSIPVDSTTGSGSGLTVDLTVVGDGIGAGGYSVTINKAGYGYVAGDSVTINNSTLVGLDPTIGAGDLTFTVDTVHSPDNATSGDLFTVVKTANAASLIAGNEAAFYWNIKQFGFYSSAS